MTRIYVGNLSYQTTDAAIRSAFERYGSVSAVHLMTDPGSGRSRGFAFINMPLLDDADEAIYQMNGSSLQGRRLVVNEARERTLSKTRFDSPQENQWHLI